MMKSTAMALVVALATFTAPAAMARPYSAYSHHAASRVTKTVRGPGYARPYAAQLGLGMRDRRRPRPVLSMRQSPMIHTIYPAFAMRIRPSLRVC